MGAAGLGIRNILCLSGDHHRFGPSPIGKPDQSDLDAVQMLWMLRRMRDEGKYLDGREIKQRPQFFLGTAASPFGAPPKYEAIRAREEDQRRRAVHPDPAHLRLRPLHRMAGGAGQAQPAGQGLCPGRAGAAQERPGGPLYGRGRAGRGHSRRTMLKRMDAAGDDKDAQQETGVAIALELIEQLKNTPGHRTACTSWPCTGKRSCRALVGYEARLSRWPQCADQARWPAA